LPQLVSDWKFVLLFVGCLAVARLPHSVAVAEGARGGWSWGFYFVVVAVLVLYRLRARDA